MKNQETLNSGKLRMIIILSVTAFLLASPMVAMQFINEVDWTLSDFVTAGVLLLSTGLAIELVIRNLKAGALRTIVIVVILMALFLIWAELAVGIFGTPFAGS